MFVGTSLSVGVTELIARAALDRGVKIFNIDPGARELAGVVTMRDASEVILPQLVVRLSAR